MPALDVLKKNTGSQAGQCQVISISTGEDSRPGVGATCAGAKVVCIGSTLLEKSEAKNREPAILVQCYKLSQLPAHQLCALGQAAQLLCAQLPCQ